jgi:2-polyprenyl-3-methyl-5-hydroxy-6-metoxy-1,4-benzoquinol methylase
MNYIKPKEVVKFIPKQLIVAGIYTSPYTIPIFGWIYFYRVKTILDFFKKIVPFKKQLNILEVGAGIGIFSVNFKNQFPHSNYYLLDLIKKKYYYYLQKLYASKYNLELKLYSNMDIQHKTRFDNRSFDVIFALDVLEHVFDPASAITEIRRILKKNGLFFISVPSEPPLIKYIRNFLDRITRLDMDPHHWEGLIKSEADFLTLLTKMEFKVIFHRKFPLKSFPRFFSYDIFYLLKK